MDSGPLILLSFLALLALSLYAALLVPFEVRFSGGYEAGEVRGFCAFCWAVVSVRLLWTEGAPSAEVALGRSVLFSTPLGGGEGEREEKAAEEESAAGPGARDLLAAARAVLPGALHLLEYLLARCRIASGRIWIQAAMGDTADTGVLFGVVQAINGVLAPTPFSVDMTPLFDGGEVAGGADGHLLVERPLTVLIAAAIFALSAPVRRTIWPLLRGEE